MNILYLSIHETLEHSEVKLFTDMGYDVFSMGVYQNSNRGGSLRGEIPNLYQNEQLKAIALQCSKENIHPEIIQWMDVCIQMHTPPTQSPPHFPWIANNLSKFGNKRVIFRSIGQNISHLEEELAKYRERGVQIVRYSPRERTIPNYAGEDAIIRFYKDPEEYDGWTGENKIVVNFTQSLKRRGDHCGYNTIMKVIDGFDAKIYGVSNEDLGELSGGQVTHEEQKKILRDARVYLYYGTAPASYTLSLIEAMMTGLPVVAAGPKFTRHLYPEQDTNEISNIIKNGENGYVSDNIGQLREYVQKLLDDHELAKRIGQAGRVTAIGLFGKREIENQWRRFLEKND